MGLDQYINKVDKEEIKYYRKNNQLQGFFERHYDQQNCEPTPITVETCDLLLKELEEGLPEAQGFFYGNYAMDEEEIQDMKELFEAIKRDILEYDYHYEYDCWY